jgi:hypothetical protein
MVVWVGREYAFLAPLIQENILISLLRRGKKTALYLICFCEQLALHVG